MKEKLMDMAEQLVPWFLSHGIRIVVILILAWLIYIVSKRVIRNVIKISMVIDNTSSTEGVQRRANTLNQIFSTSVKIAIYTIAFIMILQEFGVKVAPILAGAGIVGISIGFGGQYLIKDIISGLFIILENQYRIGDVVNFDNTGGLVEDISLRMTTLRDLDGTVHHIPHGEIKKVSNLSKQFSRVNLDIGISYNSNLEQVIEVINSTGKEMAEDPLFRESIISAPQFLRVDDFANSSIMIKILGETKPLKQWEVTGELRKRIKIAFDKAGIEIPFPQMVIHQGK